MNRLDSVFMNGERARTWNSVLKSIPGLFASVTGVTANNSEVPQYLSAAGIQEIAFQPVLYQNVGCCEHTHTHTHSLS